MKNSVGSWVQTTRSSAEVITFLTASSISRVIFVTDIWMANIEFLAFLAAATLAVVRSFHVDCRSMYNRRFASS